MKIVICLDKKDINSSVLGENWAITTTDGTIISFTKEAVAELVEDWLASRCRWYWLDRSRGDYSTE